MPIPVPIMPIATTSRAEALARTREPVYPRLQRPLQDIDRALVARRHLRHYADADADAFHADADAFHADAFKLDAFHADAFHADAFHADAFHADAFHADARNEPAVKLDA
jgi:hypothetical protein